MIIRFTKPKPKGNIYTIQNTNCSTSTIVTTYIYHSEFIAQNTKKKKPRYKSIYLNVYSIYIYQMLCY